MNDVSNAEHAEHAAKTSGILPCELRELAFNHLLEVTLRNDSGAKLRDLNRGERTREQRWLLRIRPEHVNDVVHALAQVAPVLRRAVATARRTGIVLCN